MSKKYSNPEQAKSLSPKEKCLAKLKEYRTALTAYHADLLNRMDSVIGASFTNDSISENNLADIESYEKFISYLEANPNFIPRLLDKGIKFGYLEKLLKKDEEPRSSGTSKATEESGIAEIESFTKFAGEESVIETSGYKPRGPRHLKGYKASDYMLDQMKLNGVYPRNRPSRKTMFMRIYHYTQGSQVKGKLRTYKTESGDFMYNKHDLRVLARYFTKPLKRRKK